MATQAQNRRNSKEVEESTVTAVVAPDGKLSLNFLHRLKKIRSRHVTIVIVILAAIAGAFFGLRTATIKALATRVVQQIHPRASTHAGVQVDDLYTKFFKKIGKTQFDEAAKSTGIAPIAAAFHSLWPKILSAATVATVGTVLYTNPEARKKVKHALKTGRNTTLYHLHHTVKPAVQGAYKYTRNAALPHARRALRQGRNTAQAAFKKGRNYALPYAQAAFKTGRNHALPYFRKAIDTASRAILKSKAKSE